MIRTKICGITNTRDALLAAKHGAWAVGFIFYKNSKRDIGAFKAKKIISELPPFITPVGVFVNQKEGAIKQIAKFCNLRVLQFHGEESPSFCKRFQDFKIIKAFRVGEEFDLEMVKEYKNCVSAFLFDTHVENVQGGTGKTFDWSVAKAAKDFGVPVIISGGLNSQNVRAAMEAVKPYAVDVASGVEETPGHKSERLVESFLTQTQIPVE